MGTKGVPNTPSKRVGSVGSHPTERNRSASRGRIAIIGPAEGRSIQLGGGSVSKLTLDRSTLSNNKAMMGFSVFKPGTATKQKVHLDSEELAYVIRGSGKINAGMERLPFKAGDSIHIPQGIPHGVENDGLEDVVMVFFFGTPEYPRSEDARLDVKE
jgi:quercetin dioxygenase-like cupin family protein